MSYVVFSKILICFLKDVISKISQKTARSFFLHTHICIGTCQQLCEIVNVFPFLMGPTLIFDYIKWLILLSVIQLSRGTVCAKFQTIID
jgi:hypothetical protein